MSRQGRTTIRALGAMFSLGLAAFAGPAQEAGAQAPAGPQAGVIVSEPAERAPAAPEAPGVAEVGPGTTPPALPDEVQVVRFQGPEGLKVEVLSPAPEPAPVGDNGGIATVGLKRGIGYRLRLSHLPERPGVELFPVIELVGHLHRPENIDPARFPIRVVFNQEDLDDVADHGRLVTKVLYLEDPDQAIPFRVNKDQVSSLTLNPSEQPLRVAGALGRPMAIVRIGGRRPSAEELARGAGDMGIDYAESLGAAPCPFLHGNGAKCELPCGPICTSAPRVTKPMMPRDEYLCDGGDRGVPASPGGTNAPGAVGGVEPRDAVIRFDIGTKGTSRPRILPTNVVCVYAPRFAEVRIATGASASVNVQAPITNKHMQKLDKMANNVPPRRLVQHQSAELARERARASAIRTREQLDEESGSRGMAGYSGALMTSQNEQKQNPEITRNRQQAALHREKRKAIGIKTGASPVVTGIVEGASQAVKVWGPHAMTGVETPPDLPGLAVIKRANVTEAEPGDIITYVIIYRNMGNTPIKSVSIVDSLLPRLEYKKGTARGPEGTMFSTAINRVGSLELRWLLADTLAPGATGYVSFEAIVR